MKEIRETEGFARWFENLPDEISKTRVLLRIRQLSLGNPGDVRAVGAGVSELRFHWGPGYRVYFAARGRELIVLLGGGSKRTQRSDIHHAIELARRI